MTPKSKGPCNKFNNASQYPPGYNSNTGPKMSKGGSLRWIGCSHGGRTSYGSQAPNPKK